MDNGWRPYSSGELAADRIVHAIGVTAGLAGAVVIIGLVAVRRAWGDLASVVAYATGLVAMLSFSAAYNLSGQSDEACLLRRLDHAAIFLMIAGTYTPFTVIGLAGTWSIAMTATVWALAGIGIAVKLFAPLQRSTFYSTILYLVLGWIGIVAIGPLIEALSVPVLLLLAAGGLLYSVGVVFHALQKMPYQNAIWHGFVLAAATAHFGAVTYLVAGGD